MIEQITLPNNSYIADFIHLLDIRVISSQKIQSTTIMVIIKYLPILAFLDGMYMYDVPTIFFALNINVKSYLPKHKMIGNKM